MVSNMKFFFNKNDIENMGYVFKVSNDIVYASGMLKVQKVKIELSYMYKNVFDMFMSWKKNLK